jgi:hypothetical protein
MGIPRYISDVDGLRQYVADRVGEGWSDDEISEMVEAIRGLDGWRWPMPTTDMIELLDAKGIECFSQLLEGK